MFDMKMFISVRFSDQHPSQKGHQGKGRNNKTFGGLDLTEKHNRD